jgi:murein L,D-transpeptidase YcbB/YkuD
MKVNRKYLIACVLIFFFATGCEKKPLTMVIQTDSPMAQQFYAQNHQNSFWFSSKKSIKKAQEWLVELESANRYGIVSEKMQIAQISTSLLNENKISISVRDEADQQLTRLVLNFIKELQEGQVAHFDYDEVTTTRDSVYVNLLFDAKPSETAQKMVARLDCKNADYLVLRKFLNDSITPIDTLKYKSVIKAMNYHRYFAVNGHSEYIVVNIPETVARYYRDGSLAMQMRTVVGRKKSPTPTIASHINTIVTFPFWNVPRSIAVKEILPKVQKDEIYLENNNLAVVNAKGIEVEESELDWMDYTERTFPYYFRQATGAKNSLGVLKFDFKSPYSIYLHSTNSQSGFLKVNRFLSHGCIRLEKPIDLAKSLLRGNLDIEALKSGKKDTESKIIELPQKVPVFIIYSPVSVNGDTITFLPDVYGLIK